MGTVITEVVIVSPRQPDNGTPPTETVKAIVDTGATLSVFPASTLEKLGVFRVTQATIRIGDGRRIERSVGNVEMRVEGQSVWSRVIFGQPDDPTVLGLTVLEQLGLTVDPVARRLVPTDFLLLIVEHLSLRSQLQTSKSKLQTGVISFEI